MSPATLEVMADDLRCALDPVAFAVERLEFTPDAWQSEVLRSSGQNILLNCSRQAGKSTTTAIIALHAAAGAAADLGRRQSPVVYVGQRFAGGVPAGHW